ncbi:MAG: hypothetical protein SGPRY_009667 [Prymnesium sp.]
MGRWGGGGAHSYLPVPVVEAYLRAEIEASSVDGAFECYEALLRRRRVPHQTVCTQLLELCARAAPRRCVWLLETMGEARGLDVEDYTRILRLFIMGRVSREQLEEFMELALDLLTFPDDGMHAYFAHVTTLLNLELREQVETRSRDDLEVALITHKRQEVLETLPLNPSQRRAADAALDRRLTLVQGPPGTGKTATSVHILSLWVRQLQIKPVLACADSNVAVDNMAVALAAAGLAIVRAGRSDAIRSDL